MVEQGALTLDDTKTRTILAAIKAVRLYGCMAWMGAHPKCQRSGRDLIRYDLPSLGKQG